MRQTRRIGDRQRLDLAAVDEAGAGGQVHHHRGHLTAGDIRQGWRGATVRHVGHRQAGLDLQQFHRQVVRAAGAGRGVIQAFLAPLGFGQELLGRVDLHGRTDHQDHREPSHQRDRSQILRRVIRQLLVEGGVEHQRAVVGGQHRVAVGRGARRFRRRNRRVAAGLVLDHHRLAQASGQALPDAARQEVRPAARGIRHDPAHGLGRVIGSRLLRGRAGTSQEGQGHQAGQDVVFNTAHGQVSSLWNVKSAFLVCVKHIRNA